MKLTFEHGLDEFVWDNQNRPAPGHPYRDIGICFWLDGEPLAAVVKDTGNPAAIELQEKIDHLRHAQGYSPAQVRDLLRMFPRQLPEGIEL